MTVTEDKEKMTTNEMHMEKDPIMADDAIRALKMESVLLKKSSSARKRLSTVYTGDEMIKESPVA